MPASFSGDAPSLSVFPTPHFSGPGGAGQTLEELVGGHVQDFAADRIARAEDRPEACRSAVVCGPGRAASSSCTCSP